ncbi:MAG: type II secretion system major pseudopilin GspG [Bryobacterales bacterium]|nr:type II secretion system major pseudopilin GspG [Bryobacterales bacterium]
MDKPKRNSRAGVTLIEMLVVLVIIGLFASYVGLRLWPQADKARVTAARAQITSFMSALDTYKMDVGVFPTSEMGLQALRVRPPNVPQWSGPYLAKDIPPDPWGRPYVYRYPGQNGEDPEVLSYGADGQPGGEGINADIVSWQ